MDDPKAQELLRLAGNDWEALASYRLGEHAGYLVVLTENSDQQSDSYRWLGYDELDQLLSILHRAFEEENVALAKVLVSQWLSGDKERLINYLSARPNLLRNTLEVPKWSPEMVARLDGLTASNSQASDTKATLDLFFDQLGEAAPRSLKETLRLKDPEYTVPAPKPVTLSNTLASPALQRARQSGQYWVRQDAMRALGDMGFQAIPFLRDALLTDPHPYVGLEAVGALRKLGGPDAEEILVYTVKNHPSPEVRAKALRALYELKYPGLIELSDEVLNSDSRDKDPQVQKQALWNLQDFVYTEFPQLQNETLDPSWWDFSGKRSPKPIDMPSQMPQILTTLAKVVSREWLNQKDPSEISVKSYELLGEMIKVLHEYGDKNPQTTKGMEEILDRMQDLATLYPLIAARHGHARDVHLALLSNMDKQLKDADLKLLSWIDQVDPRKSASDVFFLRIMELQLIRPLIEKTPNLAFKIIPYLLQPNNNSWGPLGEFIHEVFTTWKSQFREQFLAGLLYEIQNSVPGLYQDKLRLVLTHIMVEYSSFLGQPIADQITPWIEDLQEGVRGLENLPFPVIGSTFEELQLFRDVHDYTEMIRRSNTRGFRQISRTETPASSEQDRTWEYETVLEKTFAGKTLRRRLLAVDPATFAERIKKIMNNPALNYLAIRGHSYDMRLAPSYNVIDSKILQMGGCRSIEEVDHWLESCPNCMVFSLKNMGTTANNNDISLSISEAILRSQNWDQVRDILRQELPQQTYRSIIGPWHPAFKLARLFQHSISEIPSFQAIKTNSRIKTPLRD